ncbi:morn repeat protein [Stylonychia lemnae]|uniref:Morn repeat protein n=1 Tax=Stylonychia lemnae TaxID=5949 RepID=A0A078AQV9_STYLE|nr:morn repeat protein [Stylonychia lemnae]|eukprot:CDW84810.1 morn repeat protein [Stylonychia lemnae]
MAQLLSSSNSFVGKPFFKAPEIDSAEEFSYSTQVDIWSLGIILYYMCTKKYQYQQGMSIAQIKQKDQTKLILLEGEQKVFEPLLNQMLQLNPDLRIDALQVLLELCKLKNEPFNKHLELEEQKQSNHSQSNDEPKSAFALTIKSTNAIVNEIIVKLGEFNYGEFDKVHPNLNRIFMPIIKYDSGAMYQGEYDKCTKTYDGRGRYIWRDGAVYDGLWMDNFRDGYGRQIQSNGNYYIGELKDGKFNGYGKYYWKDGNIYEGQWVNGNKEGLGLLKWSNGDFYYGQWVNGERQGVGVYTKSSGNIEVGQWKKQQHGVLMYIAKDGEQIELRKWENGKLIETLVKTDNVQK